MLCCPSTKDRDDIKLTSIINFANAKPHLNIYSIAMSNYVKFVFEVFNFCYPKFVDPRACINLRS